MPSRPVFVHQTAENYGSTVLLVTPDPLLTSELQWILNAMGLRVETAVEGAAALTAMRRLEDSSVIVLDVRLAGMANGWLLAAMQESGVRRRCAIALIAEDVSEEWIARLRDGVIDDIVPRGADAAAWATHLSTMRRGHQMLCELERLREASLQEAQHDRVTGAFNRGTMLTFLFRETDRVQRLRGSLCLVLFAIDDFAYWNSEMGRDACDGLMREVAVRTGRMLRSYDLLGRTGPDEFLLALPGCSAINAAMMAERMRMDVFGEPFLVQDGADDSIQIRLTACFAVTASLGRSPVVVLREAEQILARGMQAGPDSICCASEPAEPSAGSAALFPDAGVPA